MNYPTKLLIISHSAAVSRQLLQGYTLQYHNSTNGIVAVVQAIYHFAQVEGDLLCDEEYTVYVIRHQLHFNRPYFRVMDGYSIPAI